MSEGLGLVDHNIEGIDNTHATGVRIILYLHRVHPAFALEPTPKHYLHPLFNPRLHLCHVGRIYVNMY